MIKEIKYSGYTAQPSDYEAPDGALALALNIANDDGYISAVNADCVYRSMPDQDFRALFIHRTTTYSNIIVFNTDSHQVYWITETDALDGVQNIAVSELKAIAVINAADITCTGTGNTLVFASGAGTAYALWRGDNYEFLGARPEFISIEFGMFSAGLLLLKDSSATISTPTEQSGSGGTHFSEEAITNISNFVLGQYLDKVNEVVKKGYFCQPFFVRYAFQLYDGSYNWHSAPVLLLPTITPPCLYITSEFTRPPRDSTSIMFNCSDRYFDLMCRILKNGVDSLSRWKDVISSVDIFVSAPIYTYDQSKPLKTNVAKFPITSWGRLAAANYRGVAPTADSRSGNVRPPQGGGGTPTLGVGNDAPTGYDAAPDTFFCGRYFISEALTPESLEDHTVSKNDSTEVFNVEPNENFHRDVASCSLFYRVATIPLENIATFDDFRRVISSDTDLTNLTTRPALPDEYDSHASICPTVATVYNRRLHLGNVNFIPAKPFPFRSMTSAAGGKRFDSTFQKVTVTVYIRKDATSLIASSPDNSVTVVDASDAYCINDLASCFPRWIYYPDSRAFKMRIACGSDVIYIPLKPHDFLNGAYYYGSFNVSPVPESSSAPAADETFATSYSQRHKLYVSDVDNPFFFQSSNIISLPSEILAMASAAKPLSQGQFGDFPLYMFTDQGVWALRVGATGTYSMQSPITRDVIISPRALVSLESSVVFVTDRGIMLLSGSQSECISESIDNCVGFTDISSLPHFSSLHKFLGHPERDCCFPIPKLREFLAGSRCAYDYITQRILFFNPEFRIALLFSMKSRLWYQRDSDLDYPLNSYPSTLVVDNYCRFTRPFADMESTLPGLLITRPLKLDGPDIHKTIDTIIQRGHFRKGHVQSVLYGSRDLINWSLVWSSKDHYLRGFRGTPYKYFRIAAIASLSPGESISGASIQFTPRKTNQLR